MLKRFAILVCAGTCVLTTLPGAAIAQGLPDNVVRAQVLAGWRTAEGTHMAALRLDMAKGWKTYWRAPGEGGIPPQFDWTGSQNISGVRFHWPRPEVFDLQGLQAIGYMDQLVLPMEFTPAVPGAPMSVSAEVDLGVCEEVCVPITLSLQAELPDQAKPDAVINTALARKPLSGAQAGLTAIRCAAEPIQDGLRVTARMGLPSAGQEEVVVFELSDASVWIAQADTWRESEELISVTDMVPPGSEPFLLNRDDIRITILGTDRAVELRGCSG